MTPVNSRAGFPIEGTDAVPCGNPCLEDGPQCAACAAEYAAPERDTLPDVLDEQARELATAADQEIDRC